MLKNDGTRGTGRVIRIGPAGWQYPDWEGLVYPQHPSRGFNALEYLAGFFDTVELNTTFYGPPAPQKVESWVRSVEHNPRFKFTAKMYRRFTHERGGAIRLDESREKAVAAFRASIAPLAAAGVLGAILVQFPWSFKYSVESRKYLAFLLTLFGDYPLVVELRHSSWHKLSVYEELRRRGVGFCNIDQPLFACSIEPSSRTTARVGYVRLHGRNYDNWFNENASAAARYDYLYSADELDPWIDNVTEVAKEARETYVVTNNHYRGKGVVNALEIKSRLLGEKVPGPASLFEEYPHLRAAALPC